MKQIKQIIFITTLMVCRMFYAQETVLTEEVAENIAEGKKTLAVLAFEGRGISEMEAATLTDRLMSEIVSTNAVIMVERTQMDEILQEQGFQQSGCTTAECAAEVGALLGVQQMVSGSFGKLGSTYTIDSKLFSVESGATIRSVSKTYKGEVDGLLPVIEVVGWELVGLTPPADLIARAGGTPEPVESQKEPRKPMSKGAKRTLWAVLLIGGGLGGAYAAGVFDPAPSPLPEPPTLPGSE